MCRVRYSIASVETFVLDIFTSRPGIQLQLLFICHVRAVSVLECLSSPHRLICWPTFVELVCRSFRRQQCSFISWQMWLRQKHWWQVCAHLISSFVTPDVIVSACTSEWIVNVNTIPFNSHFPGEPRLAGYPLILLLHLLLNCASF